MATELLINQLFTGRYLDEGENIGHEVINLFKDDAGNNNLFITPSGQVRNHDVGAVLFVCNISARTTVEVVGMAKGISSISDDEINQITYKGFSLDQIFGSNKYLGNEDPVPNQVSFRAEKVSTPSRRIFITLDNNFKFEDAIVIYLKSDRKVIIPQGMREYYSDEVDGNAYRQLLAELINKDSIWNDVNEVVSDDLVHKQAPLTVSESQSKFDIMRERFLKRISEVQSGNHMNSEILINQIFTGRYLEEGENIGHEVINLFKDDAGHNNLFITPSGLVRNHEVEGVLFVCNISARITVEVVAMAKGISTISDDEIKQITYKGYSLDHIFGDNSYLGNKDPVPNQVSFRAAKVATPTKRIFITLDNNFKSDDGIVIYLKSDRKVIIPQGMRVYYSDEIDGQAYRQLLNELINKDSIWNDINVLASDESAHKQAPLTVSESQSKFDTMRERFLRRIKEIQTGKSSEPTSNGSAGSFWDINLLKKLSYDQVRQLYMIFLKIQGIAQATINTALNDSFYIWKKGDHDLFWKAVESSDADARSILIEILRKNSSVDPEKNASSYMSHLRRFRLFLAWEGNDEAGKLLRSFANTADVKSDSNDAKPKKQPSDPKIVQPPKKEVLVVPPDLKVGDTFKFGSYYQESSNYMSPIEWIVIKRLGPKVLLMSRYGLDRKQYHHENADVPWEESDLRKWLNDTFLKTAFSEEEQKRIALTNVENIADPQYQTFGGKNTDDYIFCLSMAEADSLFDEDAARKCIPTPYAVGEGVVQSEVFMLNGKGTCLWWLRSRGVYEFGAYLIRENGSIGGYNDLSSTFTAIRPVLWMNL